MSMLQPCFFCSNLKRKYNLENVKATFVDGSGMIIIYSKWFTTGRSVR